MSNVNLKNVSAVAAADESAAGNVYTTASLDIAAAHRSAGIATAAETAADLLVSVAVGEVVMNYNDLRIQIGNDGSDIRRCTSSALEIG